MAHAPKPSHADAVQAIYAAGARPEAWPETLGLLSDYLGAAGGMLAYHALSTRTGGLVTGRLREDLTEVYLRDYIDNPYAARLARVAPGRPVIINELVAFEQVRPTSFYADILEPQHLRDQVVMTHPRLNRRDSTGGFSFCLTGPQAQDRAAVRERMAALAPHLVRAVDLAIEVGALAPGRGMAALLDALPNAAVLIDRHLCVVQANAAAEALLAEGAGLTALREDGGLRLAAALGAETRALRAALAAAVSVAVGDDRGLPAAVRISCPEPPRDGGRRTALIVVATPLPPPAFPLWNLIASGARALVQIVDPVVDPGAGARARVLEQAVGLTPAEARVAALIAGGATTPRVARALGLSPATVRTHLARCFDKTGARSQVALARLVALLGGSGRPTPPQARPQIRPEPPGSTPDSCGAAPQGRRSA